MKSYKETYETFYTGKSPETTKEHQKGKGTIDIIVSILWFLMAIISGLFGSLMFTLPGIIGGLYFLVRGLIKKGVITHTHGKGDET